MRDNRWFEDQFRQCRKPSLVSGKKRRRCYSFWSVVTAIGVAAVSSAGLPPAFGQTKGVPAEIPSSTHVNCATRLAYHPDGSAKVRPQRAARSLLESKSAAILGGQRSKLDEMRDLQASPGQSRQQDTQRPNPGYAALNGPRVNDCGIVPASSATGPLEANPSLPDNAILGTLSIKIEHSPFDHDWAAASKTRAYRKMKHTLAATGAHNFTDPAAQVASINRWVNHNIAFGEDRDVYGRADYWAPAAETLRRRVGDCEDIAIAKMELLSALGISRNKMRLVIARDLLRNADHAVLVVMLAGGDVMLDNVTDYLLDARLAANYRPIMSFSQNAKWVHGYAAQPAASPVQIVSITPPLKAVAARTGGDVPAITAGAWPVGSEAACSHCGNPFGPIDRIITGNA